MTRHSLALLPKGRFATPGSSSHRGHGTFLPAPHADGAQIPSRLFSSMALLPTCLEVELGRMEDLLPLLPFYSHSVFQPRFPLSSLPSPEQQVAETLTDP